MRRFGFTSGCNFCKIVVRRSSYFQGRTVVKGCRCWSRYEQDKMEQGMFENVAYLFHEWNGNVREEINLETRKLQWMLAAKRREVSAEELPFCWYNDFVRY